MEEFMNKDIALLKAEAAQFSEAKAKLSEKIKNAVNAALGADAVNGVLVKASKDGIEFEIFGKLG
jgi:hypothetical protein